MTNLILAVIVDKALQAHEEDLKREAGEKEKERHRAVGKFKDLCKEMDTDQSGSVSMDEVMIGFDEMPAFKAVLEVMDVGKRELEVLFHIMDVDRSGEVPYNEFAQELAKVKNSNLATMTSFTKHHVMEMRLMMDHIAEAVLPVEVLQELKRTGEFMDHVDTESNSSKENAPRNSASSEDNPDVPEKRTSRRSVVQDPEKAHWHYQ